MEQKIKFPRSQKVYLPGKLYPNIRVAMRKVEQVPSVSFEGEEKIATPNPEIYVYDTSGPFSDADMSIDLKKGLPRMREEWIVGRGDVEIQVGQQVFADVAIVRQHFAAGAGLLWLTDRFHRWINPS